MKKKVGTLINSQLMSRLKLFSAREGKTINSMFEEALELFLKSREEIPEPRASLIANETWGTYKVKEENLRMVMMDENWYEL